MTLGKQPQLILTQRSQWKPEEVTDKIVPAGKNYPVNHDFGDYTPLFLIPFISTMGENVGYYSGDYSDRLSQATREMTSTPILKVVKNKLSEMNVQTNNARIAFFETFGPLVQSYCNANDARQFVDFTFGMYYKYDTLTNSYDQLFEAQSGLTPSLIRLRSQSYYSGFGALFNEQGNLIWTLAVKNEHVKYVKLCYLLGKPVDPRVLVFMSQETFDTKNTFNKPLRTAFRKQMKGWLIENEVPMVEVDFNEVLCGRVTVPDGITSIRDTKNWESETVANFIESYRVEDALDAAGVELAF